LAYRSKYSFSLKSHDLQFPGMGSSVLAVASGNASVVRFSDLESAEVACPNCGSFEISRAEFDQAQADMTEPDEP
jgi:predicted RNA-binding Zn-ribbon protein involved in translation (DUF1610 family)